MQRTFYLKKHGTMSTVTLSLAPTNAGRLLVAHISTRTGFGGSGRREDLGLVPGDVVTLIVDRAPGWVLADALEEIGLDCGMTDVVRADDDLPF